jgi:hypothetical protein
MNTLWVGVLVGVFVGAFAYEWVKLATVIVAFIFSGLFMRLERLRGQRFSHLHFMLPPSAIAIVAVLIALFSWHYARKRGLQHLGQHELRTRWNNVRGISKWGW